MKKFTKHAKSKLKISAITLRVTKENKTHSPGFMGA